VSQNARSEIFLDGRGTVAYLVLLAIAPRHVTYLPVDLAGYET